MLKPLSYIVLSALLSFYGLSAPINSHSTPTARERTLDGEFGRPVGVATGQEVIQQNMGFLECASRSLQANFRHSSTSDASQKLAISPDPHEDAVIVGHGAPGVLCTGDGDNCSGDDTKMVASFNVSSWNSLFVKLQGDFQTLTLLGCDVGQKGAGADLLYSIAQATQRTVRAPDSIIFCDAGGITFAAGGSWVEATPTVRPIPNVGPQYRIKPSNSYKFKIDGALTSAAPNSVKLLEFQHRDYQHKEFQTLRQFEGPGLLNLLNLGEPFETTGRPGAIVTGKLRLQIRIKNKSVNKAFILYNDELLQDVENPDVFYHADTQLSQYIDERLK
jgi:hypothetical protein